MDEEEYERRKAPWVLFGCATGSLAALLAFVLFVKIWPQRLAANEMKYQDLISVVLTALAVLMAVLGIFVATLAVWGYAAFERLAKDAARKYVVNDIKSGKLKIQTEALVTEFIKRESGDGGLFSNIMIAEANRIALANQEKRSPITGVPSEDEDEGDA